jgi:membrane-associated protease RseP (regulator of RpoE activity)
VLALYVLISALIVGFSVLAHEYGHLVAARRNKMHVTGFSIGFGMPLTSWITKRGLPVTLRVIPLGGSTKIAKATTESDDEIPEGLIGYIDARPFARWRVTTAGSLANILLAWVAFSMLAWTYGKDDSRNLIIIPLAGALVIGLVLALLASGIILAVTGGGEGGVSSILGLPHMLQEGVQSVGTTHGGVAFYLLSILGLINISIALGNLLPLYPLDGFRAIVAAIDGFRHRKQRASYLPLTDEQLKKPALISGGLFVLAVAFVLLRDIGKYLLG